MKRHLIIIAVLALLVPGVLLAQDGITLEGLAKQVTDLAERVAKLEEIREGPGSRRIRGQACIIGEDDMIQDESVLKYKEQYDEWLDVDDVTIVGVVHHRRTGYTSVTLSDSLWEKRYITETWEGCEFIESSNWWEPE